MNVSGQPYHTIWWHPHEPATVRVIDQRLLPHEFVIEDLRTVDEVVSAIAEMHVRGAPLIGAAAACGVYLATVPHPSDTDLDEAVVDAATKLKRARPTAINLAWAVDRAVRAVQAAGTVDEKRAAARYIADAIIQEELGRSRAIAEHGLQILEKMSRAKSGRPVNILTHCNAGWLACIDLGTATAPIYRAFDEKIPLHVWVDETRPRNQGARLTAWELGQHGVPHTVIVDNAAGHLMQRGQVDLVIVGTDRTTAKGDVVNKIGTYQKALAAADNKIPFYVAAPSSSVDWAMGEGMDVPIEERDAGEVKFVQGLGDAGRTQVQVAPADSPVANYAFDVTPARLVTSLITERGICAASSSGLSELFPELVQEPVAEKP